MPKTNTSVKRVPTSTIFSRAVFVNNPVLIQVVGICPVVGAAVSLQTGLLLASVFAVNIFVCQCIASAFLKTVPRWIRVTLYLLLGLVVICPAMYYMEVREFAANRIAGIYLPLMAVNSLTALRCEKVAVRSSVRHSVIDSVAVGLGYGLVTIAVGIVRELLGSGAFAGKSLSFLPQASGMLMPFGGFLVLGFAAAVLRRLILRNAPERAADIAFEVNPSSVRVRSVPVVKPPAQTPAIDSPVADVSATTDAATTPLTQDEPIEEEPVVTTETSSDIFTETVLEPELPATDNATDAPSETQEIRADTPTVGTTKSTLDTDDSAVSNAAEDLATNPAEEPGTQAELDPVIEDIPESEPALPAGSTKSIDDLLSEMRFFIEQQQNGLFNTDKEGDDQ